MIKTSIYRMGRGKFALCLMNNFARFFIISIGPAIIILNMLSGIDLRFAILASMFLFLVTPMLLAFLYFNHALRPLTSVNVANHSIEFFSDKMLIKIFGNKDPEMNNNVKDLNERGDSESSEKGIELLATREIDYSIVNGYDSDAKSVTIFFKTPSKELIWIPTSAFSSNADFREAMELVFPDNVQPSVSQDK